MNNLDLDNIPLKVGDIIYVVDSATYRIDMSRVDSIFYSPGWAINRWSFTYQIGRGVHKCDMSAFGTTVFLDRKSAELGSQVLEQRYDDYCNRKYHV